jgi:Na+-transporting NADH:ubiquinone oxidoreductase subunit NqrC
MFQSMRTKHVIYILVTVLVISLVGNEILYGYVQSLQKDLKEYADANNQIIQKASNISDAGNKTMTAAFTP